MIASIVTIAHISACLIGLFVPVLAFAGPLPKPTDDTDYRRYTRAQVQLGQLLFYDRALSGTYRVSCATCHNHDRASSNGFLLQGVEAAKQDQLAINGLSLYEQLKPSTRHAPALFNLGAKEFSVLFSDGRVAQQKDGTFISPHNDRLPEGLQDVLALQALFPAIAKDELVGQVDNEINAIAHEGNEAVWNALAKRIADIPDYIPLFQRAFRDVNSAPDISIAHIANALSAFVATEWRSDGAPFDNYLKGNRQALSDAQKRGMELFYGKAGCHACHSGVFQTDHQFHRIGMPSWRHNAEFGESEKSGFDDRRGRANVTGHSKDLYAFRTPSLRNVGQTAPYGHAGSYKTLKEAVVHHFDPDTARRKFMTDRGVSSDRYAQLESDITDLPVEKSPILLDGELGDLLSFLEALTDPSGIGGKLGKPAAVPSSLALD